MLASWLLKRQIESIKEGLQSEVAALRSEFEQLRAEGLPAPPPNGFNLNRRPDTVRRLRRGQPIDDIALATGWSLAEIALLKKIEKLQSS